MADLLEVSADVLRAEADALPTDKFPLAHRLIFQEIERIQSGKSWREDRKMIDVTKEKCIRLSSRVYVPSKEHPKFNFVGKLLGPKGNSLKRLQEDTMTKMAILGRGSMRDKQKEQTLRATGDPKFSHLADDLHVEVTSFAPPAEAHARMAFALSEVRRFLVPDYNDDIRQEQMREMQKLITESDKEGSASAESPPLPAMTAAKYPSSVLLQSVGLPGLVAGTGCHPALRGLQTAGGADGSTLTATTQASSIQQSNEELLKAAQLRLGYMGAASVVPDQIQLMEQLLASSNGMQLPAIRHTAHLTGAEMLEYSGMGTSLAAGDIYQSVLSQNYPALIQSTHDKELLASEASLKLTPAHKMAVRYDPYSRGGNVAFSG